MGRKLAAINCHYDSMASSIISRVTQSAASIPPMRAAALLPFLTMLILWTGLTASGWPQEIAFVIVLVIAQAHLLWRNLPRAAFTLDSLSRRHSRLLTWAVIITLALAALQLIVSDPLFTQRLLSAGCIFVLVVMLLGARQEEALMDELMQSIRSDKPLSEPVSLLRINALFAAAVLCVNEMLIASGSLTVWIVATAVLMMVFRSAYWFVVLMVIPEDEMPGDQIA